MLNKFGFRWTRNPQAHNAPTREGSAHCTTLQHLPSSSKAEQWRAGQLIRVHEDIFFTAYIEGSCEMKNLMATSAVLGEREPVRNLRYLNTAATCKYHAFCKDFGPFNEGNTAQFCSSLIGAQRTGQESHQADRSVVVFTTATPQNMTNAAFVIGVHLILHKGLTAEQAWEPFLRLPQGNFMTFHDATWEERCFPLTILDCLRGVQRAKENKFIHTHFKGFKKAVYDYYDNPRNGDLHEVVPGKFLAFAGPTGEVEQYMGYCSTLTPADYKEPFQKFGVTLVIRLNERDTNDYDSEDFKTMGMQHYDLIFSDCTNPPQEIIIKFLKVCEEHMEAGGMVAVHCKAGLGRTGTLIALWMMKHHNFTAREAIGWLRFVRPGSVIHNQQQFLVDMEEYMHDAGRSMRERLSRLRLVEATSAKLEKSIEDKGGRGSWVAPNSVLPPREIERCQLKDKRVASELAGEKRATVTAENDACITRRRGSRMSALSLAESYESLSDDARSLANTPIHSLPGTPRATQKSSMGKLIKPSMLATAPLPEPERLYPDKQMRCLATTIHVDLDVSKRIALDNTISMQRRAAMRYSLQNVV